MNTFELISKLHQHNIRISESQGKLLVDAAKGALNAELTSLIKANKAQLIAFLRQQSSYGSAMVQNDEIPACPRSCRRHFELSFAQQRLWFVDQMFPGTAQYNMPSLFEVAVGFDLAAADNALTELIARHEILRTCYQAKQDQIHQVIQPAAAFGIVHHDVTGLSGQQQRAELARLVEQYCLEPFDLKQDLMLKAHFFATGQGGQAGILLLNLHHIACDGWSVAILVEEFLKLYQACKHNEAFCLSPLSIQYADYAQWQRSNEQQLNSHLDYWRQQLADVPQVHQLPLDYERPVTKAEQGELVSYHLAPAILTALKHRANSHGMTLFMLLHGALTLVLSRHSNNKDIVVGTPVANRSRAELEPLIGCFVNTLVLRTSTAFDGLNDFLMHVKDVNLNAQAHQDIPFEQLVDHCQIERTAQYTPLVQIMFGLDGSQFDAQAMNQAGFMPMTNDIKLTKFDLDIVAREQNDVLQFDWLFDISLFTSEHVQTLSEDLGRVLEAMADGGNMALGGVPILSPVLLSRLLTQAHHQEDDFNHSATVHQLFEQQCQMNAAATAVEYIDQEGIRHSCSYGQLNQAANRLARHLLALGLEHEGLVGICLERSIDMIVALLAVHKAGGAYVPLDPEHPKARLQAIVEQTDIRLLLGQSTLPVMAELTQWLSGAAQVVELDVLQTKSLLSGYADDDLRLNLTPRSLAYVIFTSGSSGQPKGVMVEHPAMANLLKAMAAKLDVFCAGKRFLALTTVTFDIAGLELFGPLCFGGELVIGAACYSQDPYRLGRLLSKYPCQAIQGTPSTWQSLINANWQGDSQLTAISGGEALNTELAEQLLALTARLYNCYGPTEATVWSMVKAIGPEDVKQPSIPLGGSLSNYQHYVLSDDLQLLPPGTAGELYIGGHGLARGYLNQPELTAECFVAHPFSDMQGERLYKTGDWVRQIEVRGQSQVQWQFLGRIDDQLKIRGFRVELGEVEFVLRQCSGVSEAIAVVCGDNVQQQFIMAYVVSDEYVSATAKPWLEQLKTHMAAHLPHYMCPVDVQLLTQWPLMPNGKIDKRALTAKGLNQSTESYQAPNGKTEQALTAIWASLLNLCPGAIARDSNFFKLGGNSLLSVRLVTEVREQMQCELSIKTVFEHPTVAQLARRVESDSSKRLRAKITRRLQPGQTQYVASFTQSRLWFIDHLQGGSAEYNMPTSLLLEGAFDLDIANRVIASIIERHAPLRTVFKEVDGVVMQSVMVEFDFAIDVVDLTDLTSELQQQRLAALLAADRAKAFDLAADLMFRASFIYLSKAEGETKGVLSFNMPHIAADAWSMQLLLQEFVELYQALQNGMPHCLAPLHIEYGDFALWQREWLQGEVLDTQLNYWLAHLAEIPPVHSLPLDKPRPKQKSSQGLVVKRQWGKAFTARLKDFALQHNMTPFMLLHAGLALVLSRHSNTDDIVMGTSVANRLQAQVEGLVGCFVNTLVLRCNTEHQCLGDYFAHIREVNLCAQANQDIPLELLVEKMKVPRSSGHAPVFQIMFTMNTNEMQQVALDDVAVSLLPGVEDVTRFDLDINVHLSDSGCHLDWLYDCGLFEHQRIESMADHLYLLLTSIMANPQQPLAQLSIVDAAQQRYLAEHLSDPSGYLSEQQMLHRRFEAQVLQFPENVALVYEDEQGERAQMTYLALNEQANKIAAHLREQGVGCDMPVGLCLERSGQMVVGLMAILKAGGAYVPLDPNQPTTRLETIIDDADFDVLLTHSRLLNDYPFADKTLVLLDEAFMSFYDEYDTQNLTALPQQGPRNLAYVIYTSGSTGQPKGVMVEHGGVDNMVRYQQQVFNVGADAKVLHFASFGFDASVSEWAMALLSGASLHICTEHERKDMSALSQRLCQDEISHMTLPPVLLELLDPNFDHRLKSIIVAGDACSTELVERWAGQCCFFNAYGPTEASVCASIAQLDGHGPLSIGCAVANTDVYILDKYQRVLPFGAVGELYIGGAGLARGYLNQSQLSEASFVARPPQVPGHGPLYKTGDLARYLVTEMGKEKPLSFVGRVDSQIKIRGYRIELGEVISNLHRCQHVETATVVVSQSPQSEGSMVHKRLIAYVVARATSNMQPNFEADRWVEQLRSEMAAMLPEYMLPAAYVVLQEMPINQNGKIDHQALPAADFSQFKQHYIAPQNPLEHTLVTIWSQLLQVDEDKIGVGANFFELGGDSILSIQLVSRAASQGIHFSVDDLFSAQTIEKLRPLISDDKQVDTLQVTVIGNMPLLPIQRAFFEDETALHHYNQSVMLNAPEALTLATLKSMVKVLFEQHDALRLQFERGDSWQGIFQPMAQIDFDKAVIQQQCSNETLSEIVDDVQRSLKPQNGDLFKAALLHVDDKPLLLIVIHHLVVDGVSWRVLLEDLLTLAQQWQNRTPLRLGAKTTSYQQWGEFIATYSQSAQLQAEKAFWLAQLQQPIAPFYQPEMGEQGTRYDGKRYRVITFTIDSRKTTQLLGQCNASYRTQINELLLTALLFGYHQYSDLKAMRLDLEGHGREPMANNLDLSRTVGWFTSIYPLVLQFEAGAGIADVLCEVKNRYRTIANNGLGFGVLNAFDAAFSAQAQAARAELLFNYLGQFDQLGNDASGFSLSDRASGQDISPLRQPSHPLAINGWVSEQKFCFSLKYDASRYHQDAMAQFMGAFESALGQLIEHCQQTPWGKLCPGDFPLAQVSQAKLRLWQLEHNSEVEDLYPATGMQQGLLFHSLLNAGSYVTQNQFSFEKLDIECFKSAWQHVVQRHVIFRTAFVGVESGDAHQVVYRAAMLPWQVVDLTNLTPPQQQLQLEEVRAQDVSVGFDLTQPPLMRFTLVLLGSLHSVVLWSHHHSIIDGWSGPVVFAEVVKCYQALRQQQPPELPPVYSYRDYMQWLGQQSMAQAKQFWSQQLSTVAANTPLPLMYDGVAHEYPPEHSEVLEQVVWLDEAQTQKLQQLASAAKTTVNIIVQAAWGLLLANYSGAGTVVFGATTSGRPAQVSGIEHTVGLFINTLPVVIDTAFEVDVAQWLQQLQNQALGRERYNYLPLADIQRLHQCHQPLFDSLLVFENYPVEQAIGDKANEAGLTVNDFKLYESTHYTLTLTAHLSDRLKIKLEARQSQRPITNFSQVAGHLRQLLLSFAELSQPGESRLSELSMLTKAQIDQQLFWLNGATSDFAKETVLHQWFELQAKAKPQHCALRYLSAEGTLNEMSYEQLNAAANRLAHYLSEYYQAGDNLVAVCAPRSPELIIGLLAILKSGGAYVPLDPEQPVERWQYQIQHAKVKVVLSTQQLRDKIPCGELPCLALDAMSFTKRLETYPATNLNPQVAPESLAYVIYTSGSTGKPKGVMIEQSNVTQLVIEEPAIAIDSHDCVAYCANPAFDASTWEIWLPLLNGATMLLISQTTLLHPSQFNEILQRGQATVLQLTAGLFRQYAKVMAPAFSRLNYLLFGGDTADINAVIDVYQNARPKHLLHTYGPTETVAFTVVHEVDEQVVSAGVLPIGRPMCNSQVYVLDDSLQPVACGVVGQLYIGGEGVGRGYLDLSDEQALVATTAFIDNPFSAQSGAKLYKTGDLVRYLADEQGRPDCLVFVGRVDDQVKINGFRVEPGEIEQHLGRCAGVSSAVVSIAESMPGHKQVVGYFVADKARSGEKEPLADSIRAALKVQLPSHMIPSALIEVEHFELTANGKVDKRSLPSPAIEHMQSQYLAPRNEIEKALVELWSELLGLDRNKLGIEASFFDLGGHSLLALQLTAQIKEKWAIDFALKDLFGHSSIEQLAKAIVQGLALNDIRRLEANSEITSEGFL